MNLIGKARLFIDQKQTLEFASASDLDYQNVFALVKLVFYSPCCTRSCGASNSTNNKAGNWKFYKPKYALNEPKCATFHQNAYHIMHWDADLVPRP